MKEKSCKPTKSSALESKLNIVLYLLNCILDSQSLVLRRQKKTLAILDEVLDEVTETTNVMDSAVVLLDGLKAALDAAGTDPVKLQAIKDSLVTNKQELAEAITRNTPAQV